MKRYFKATDGNITVFRSSDRRTYASAWFTSENARPTGDIGFSSKPVPLGKYPAVEIDKAEFDRLTAIKIQRITASGGNPKYASPQSSWVPNSELGGR